MKHLGIQAISAFLGGAFVMALQGPIQSPSHQDAQAIPTCAKTIEDVTTGNCISVNSIPTLGSLYPMTQDLIVDPGGNVGIGTTMPTAKLDVAGRAVFDGPAGIGTADPQYDLQVVGQGSSSLRVGASDNGSFTPPNAELFAYGGGLDGLAQLTLTGAGCLGNANVVLAGPNGYLPITFNHHWDETLFHILYGSVYLMSMTRNAFTTTGIGPQITIGTRGVIPNGSYLPYFQIGSTTLRVNGDVSQRMDDSGLLKAGCHVDGTTTPPTISRFFSDLPLGFVSQTYPYNAQVVRTWPGVYAVSFDSDYQGGSGIALDTRFFQVTLGSATNATVPPGFVQVHPGTNSVIVETFDVTGTPADNQFYLAVY